MTLVKNALHGRIVVHCSYVVAYQVTIKHDSRTWAPDLLLSCASAQSHYCTAILLSLGPFDIKYISNIVDADYIC